MQLEAERSADLSGDAPGAGSVRGALAASLSRAPFGGLNHGPESLRGRHFRRRGVAATSSGTSFPSNCVVTAKITQTKIRRVQTSRLRGWRSVLRAGSLRMRGQRSSHGRGPVCAPRDDRQNNQAGFLFFATRS